MEEIDFSYGQVEAMLMVMLRAPGDARMRLRSRVQHFQRAAFPPGVNVGKGAKHRYDLEDTFQLLFAFVLLDLNWTSLIAADFLRANWDSFAPLVEEGWQEARRGNARRSSRRARLLICPNGLGSIGPGINDVPTVLRIVSGETEEVRTPASAGCIIDVVEISRAACISLLDRRLPPDR